MIRLLCKSLLVPLLVATPAVAQAQEPTAVVPPVYWHGALSGSEQQFNPATVWLNGTYDILRGISYQDSPFRVDYWGGIRNVGRNLLHPLDNLDRIGWARFAAHEIFPYRGWDVRYGQFVPNIVLHGFGEGMLYRKLDEWYAAHDVAYPRLAALGTIVAMQLGNEVVENGGYQGAVQDPIADVWIFNPIGLLLFSHDPFVRALDRWVHISYWPSQAVFAPQGLRLLNAGENYGMKVTTGLPVRGFMYYGVQGLFGASVPLGAGHDLSVAGGYRLLQLKAEERVDGRTMVPDGDGDWELGVFWDRDDSLQMSAIAGLVTDPSLRFEFYPGLLNLGPVSLGGFVKVSSMEGFATGLTIGGSPLGLGALAPRDHGLERF